MKIAVTGGSGFIGRWLVDLLLEHGHEVRNVDRVTRPGLAPTVLADLADLGEARRALAGVDAVFHLAGFVDGATTREPLTAFEVHVTGTLNVVRACLDEGVGWLGLASSFLVYRAAAGPAPYDEATPIRLDALGPFEAGKLAAEMTIGQAPLFGGRGLPHAVFRFGSAYGPGNGSNVIGHFVDAARAGRPIEIWGDGTRPNQFTYVEDIAAGCVLALGRQGVFNLVSPEVVTTGEAAAHMREHYDAEVVYRTDRTERETLGNISSALAQRELGWRPRPLRDGLDRTMHAFVGSH